MKFKPIILLIILSILSGCSAEYNIDIKDKSVLEQLNINNIDVNNFKNINLPIDHEVDEYDVFEKKDETLEYYDIAIKNDVVNISYNFHTNNYNTSMLFNSCYENTVYTKDNHEILINTSNKFLCFDAYEELDDLKIKITSKYKLIETNADKKEKYNYYWYINKENKDNKKIYLRLDTTTVIKTIFEKLTDIGLITPLILVSVILITLIIIRLVKIVGERRNKI